MAEKYWIRHYLTTLGAITQLHKDKNLSGIITKYSSFLKKVFVSNLAKFNKISPI